MTAKIAGINGTDIMDVNANNGAHVTPYNSGGSELGTAGNPIVITPVNPPPHPATGGFYSVCGYTGTIAAGIAANTSLMSMRFSSSSTRIAYVKKMRVDIAVITVGATGLIPTPFGLQRFTSATPSGGSAFTPANLNESLDSATDMTDVRANASALTVTSVVFGSVIDQVAVPVFISGSGPAYTWNIQPTYPIVLQAGDGLALRIQSVGPATQTWMFSFVAEWEEK